MNISLIDNELIHVQDHEFMLKYNKNSIFFQSNFLQKRRLNDSHK